MTALRAIGTAPATWIAIAAASVFAAFISRIDAANRLALSTIFHSAGPAPNGAWLTNFVTWMAGASPWPLEETLTVFSAVVMSLLLAWLYRRLVYNDWPPVQALLFVALLAGNAMVITAITGIDHRSIPVMVACIAVIPGIRRLESVGDAQAAMSFGLVLPLLFLSGPALTFLIPLLALFGALSDETGRHDFRGFTAMFLIAIMPTLLVMTGMFGMIGVYESAHLFRDVYVPAATPDLLNIDGIRILLRKTTNTVLPFAIVTVSYMFYRDRRWQPWSAAAVLGIPFYLVAGAIFFSWPLAPSTPTLAFLGAYASWLSVARLTRVFRWASLALMLVTTAISWSTPALTHALRFIPVP